MNFELTEQQVMLSDMLGRYLHQNHSIERRLSHAAPDREWYRGDWDAMAELGIPTALFGEAFGGLRGSAFDVAVVFEQLGNALVSDPWLGTLMAARALELAGGQDDLIGAAIGGQAVLTFAAHEEHGGHDPHAIGSRATLVDGQWFVTGAKNVVPELGAATHIVLSALADDGEPSIYLCDPSSPGVSIRTFPLVDGGAAGDIILKDVPAICLARGATSIVDDVMAWGIAALCWEAVGVMDVVKTMTLEYLSSRKQFGVLIGKFQALQHRIADMAIQIEQARSAAINATAALDSAASGRDRAVSAAKVTIGATGRRVAEEAIQLHGGIGMTWELPLSHYVKRLVMIDHKLGDEDWHLAKFIAQPVVAQPLD